MRSTGPTMFNFVSLFASGGPTGGDKRVLKQTKIETNHIHKIFTSVNLLIRYCNLNRLFLSDFQKFRSFRTEHFKRNGISTLSMNRCAVLRCESLSKSTPKMSFTLIVLGLAGVLILHCCLSNQCEI